jgi:hypothetical protein
MPGMPPPVPGKGAGSAAPVVPGAAPAAAAPAKYAGGGGNAIPPPGRRGGCAWRHTQSTGSGREQRQKRREQRGGSHTHRRSGHSAHSSPPGLLVSDHRAAVCCVVKHKASGRLAASRFCPVSLRAPPAHAEIKENKRKQWKWIGYACRYMLVLFFLLCLFCGVRIVFAAGKEVPSAPFRWRFAALPRRTDQGPLPPRSTRGEARSGRATQVISAACLLWCGG